MFEPVCLPSDSQERHVQECSRDKHSAGSGVPVPDDAQFYVVVCSEPPCSGIMHGIEEQGIMSRLGKDGKKILQLGGHSYHALTRFWQPPDNLISFQLTDTRSWLSFSQGISAVSGKQSYLSGALLR